MFPLCAASKTVGMGGFIVCWVGKGVDGWFHCVLGRQKVWMGGFIVCLVENRDDGWFRVVLGRKRGVDVFLS